MKIGHGQGNSTNRPRWRKFRGQIRHRYAPRFCGEGARRVVSEIPSGSNPMDGDGDGHAAPPRVPEMGACAPSVEVIARAGALAKDSALYPLKGDDPAPPSTGNDRPTPEALLPRWRQCPRRRPRQSEDGPAHTSHSNEDSNAGLSSPARNMGTADRGLIARRLRSQTTETSFGSAPRFSAARAGPLARPLIGSGMGEAEAARRPRLRSGRTPQSHRDCLVRTERKR